MKLTLGGRVYVWQVYEHCVLPMDEKLDGTVEVLQVLCGTLCMTCQLSLDHILAGISNGVSEEVKKRKT